MTGRNQNVSGGSIIRRFAMIAGMLGMTLFLMGSGCPGQQCESDSDCDDGNLCTINTCGEDGQCVTTDKCGEGEVCDPDTGTCLIVCVGDEDCDDGDMCTTDACIDGVCEVTAVVVCDEGLFCDSDTGECVECVVDEDCEEGEVCEDGACVPAPVECDDENPCEDSGDLCNPNVCVDGECVIVPVECPEGEFCDPDTGACTPEGGEFVFTLEQDTFTGTPGDDVFTGSVGTLQAVDIAVSNGGFDVVNAVVAGNTASLATLIQMSEVNFQVTFNSAVFDARNTAAIGAFNVAAGSSGNLTLSNVQDDEIGLGMPADYAKRLLVAQGAPESTDLTEVNLALGGTALGAIFEYARDAADLALLNIDVAGDNFLTNSGGAGFFGDVAEVVITGGSSLNLAEVTPAAIGAAPIDASELDGDLILWGLAGAFDFKDGGTEQVLGITGLVITDEALGAAGNYTFDRTDGPITVEVASLAEGEVLNALTFAFDGSNNNDTINLTLGGDGDGTGLITGTAGVDILSIVSTGTTDNAVADVNLGYTAFPAAPKVVNVSGDQNLDLGVVTANTVNATGFAGDLTVTGSAQNNLIIGGDGDDEIEGAALADTLTGGPGDDVFVYNAAADMNGDTITDLTDGDVVDLTGLYGAAADTFTAGTTIAALVAGNAGQIVRLSQTQTTAELAAAAAAGTTNIVVLAIDSTKGHAVIIADADWNDAGGRHIIDLPNITTLAGINALSNGTIVK
ncbi:MAG: hypothetical protein GXY44_08900 [Phycisphaerales bacterium]|nr:hypothetical protein [Phycisphaerales bacterium]